MLLLRARKEPAYAENILIYVASRLSLLNSVSGRPKARGMPSHGKWVNIEQVSVAMLMHLFRFYIFQLFVVLHSCVCYAHAFGLISICF